MPKKREGRETVAVDSSLGKKDGNSKRKERKMKRYVVNESEGVKGKLPVPGGGGTFNILIDEETSGAQHFSLLVNEMATGYKGKEHSHNVEHCWYILRGTGIIRMGGETYHINPGDAVFAPIGMPHSVECTGNEPLRYVVVYAPPGPEKELRSQTGFAKQ